MSDDAAMGKEPTEIPKADLGSVFAPSTSRAAGLGGLLQRAPTPSAPAAPHVAEPEPTDAETSSARPAARTRRTRQTGSGRRADAEAASRARATGRLVQVVTYVPVSLKGRLEQAATGPQSYTTIAMAAIDAHRDELQGRWAETRPKDSVFVGWQRGRRRNEEPMVSVTLRMVREDEKTLDRLWAEAGAPNRSAYVEAALDLHLPPLSV